jgi:hypothetical protein
MNDHDIELSDFFGPILSLIEDGDISTAAELFNSRRSEIRHLLLVTRSRRLTFFVEVDEYLNDEFARMADWTSREDVLLSYQIEQEHSRVS